MGILNRKSKQGFTLIELLIAIAIVAVLAAVAVPSYLSYLRSAEVSGTVAAADALKGMVAKCIKKNSGLARCASGSNGIPVAVAATTAAPGTSVAAGVITATTSTGAGYSTAGSTYVLTPEYKAGSPITWTATGTACSNNYVDC